MKRLVFLMVAGAVMAAGCGSTPGKNLNVQMMKNDPPMGCRMVGDVQSDGDDMNEAKAYLREAAAEKGGNYVRLDALNLSRGGAIAAGTAFNCQKPGTAKMPESIPVPKSE